MKKIAVITDAWHPQINGVVRVTETIRSILLSRGYEVLVINPGQFKSITVPFYPEIRLALFPARRLSRMLREFGPDAIHLQTEGPLGFAARGYCRKKQIPFTTWYHTHFYFYLNMRVPGLLRLVMSIERRFHNTASATFVSGESLKQNLGAHGFNKLSVVPLGVDTHHFVRNLAPTLPQLPKPVYVFFSRLAPEKNPEEFLQLTLPGTKLVIGDGPDKERLEKKYKKDTEFVGYKKGQELVDYLSLADVMVFPSSTETFGLVILEALACGIPVAAHNVMGPRDIITHGKDGYLSDNLEEAALACLTLNRDDCRKKALHYTWEASVDAFIKNLVPVK